LHLFFACDWVKKKLKCQTQMLTNSPEFYTTPKGEFSFLSTRLV
jgi:hypothetical protein